MFFFKEARPYLLLFTLLASLSGIQTVYAEAASDGVKLGGAVRFQYILTDYNDGQKRNNGDFEFDIFRLDLSAEQDGLIFSAQYRWFDYMEALQHAYVGYRFLPEWEGHVGMVIQPFGNMPYNSHNYFFSSNFYLGFEDNPGAGVRFLKRSDDWDFDFAFIFNDELGGVRGSKRSATNRYAYDVTGIRLAGEDVYDDPSIEASENNTVMFRGAKKWLMNDKHAAELGVSLHYGSVQDAQYSLGTKKAYGLHGRLATGRWEFMGQFTHYDYDLDIDAVGMVMGAYAYYDTIPTAADSYTANFAYSLPVTFGPVSNLLFYNNLSVVTNKRHIEGDTLMNITGMAVTAGRLYTYVDFVVGKNQPFINGSTALNISQRQHRLNINFGYYF